MNKVITINRQFSSGGREIGKRLADTLEWSYYDKELIKAISQETGLSEEYLEMYDEKATRFFPYVYATSFDQYIETPLDKVQVNYRKVLKDIARKGNAVIIGRCACNILNDEDPFKVFIYSSDINKRIERCYEKVPEDREKKTKEQMKKEILSIDKQRARYFNYNTFENWTDIKNYNLCIDTSKIDIKKAVELIAGAIS